MKKIIYILISSLLTLTVTAQNESGDLRTGNNLYKASKFTEAEIAYRKGLIKNKNSFEANYNLGNALFRQKKYSEAIEQYNIAIATQPKEKEKIAAALHNTGNSLLVDNKIEESIKAFKSALKSNPKDNETRYNLAYAQAMLKKQQQNKDKNKDKKDQNKDKEKQDQQQKQEPQNQQQKQEKSQQQESKMSKENAQQILDALSQDEKNAQDKAKKQVVRGTKKAEKDW